MIILQNTGLPPDLKEKLIESAIVGVFGLVGTIVSISFSWFKDRDVSTQRVHQLDEATKRVAFWEAWLKAIAPLDCNGEMTVWQARARAELTNVSSTIELLFQKPAALRELAKESREFPQQKRELPNWRRWLLLYHPPRFQAWIPRVLFYIYVLLGTFLLAVGLIGIRDLHLAFGALISVAINVGLAVLFRRWAMYLEKPKQVPLHQT